MDDAAFKLIADQARLLYTGYQAAANDLHCAEQRLQGLRRNTLLQERFPDLWQEQVANEERYLPGKIDACDRYQFRLNQLTLHVPQRLPKVWPALRLVKLRLEQGAAWHEIPNFDWDAAEGELRSIEAAAEAARSSGDKTPRRPRKKLAPRKLTEIQRKTLEVVAECKGNVAKAAGRLGKDPKTVKEAYRTALLKLGKEPTTYGKVNTGTYFRDKRGQDDVADIDDQRRESNDDQRRRYRKR
jgi:hypothetical protein